MSAEKSIRFRKVWGAPIFLGALTTFGLLAALLGVGIWHWLAWGALTVPVAAGLGFWAAPRG